MTTPPRQTQPPAGTGGGTAAPVLQDFLSGDEEVEYAHQQSWGAYWTGARLLVAGWVMVFGAFLFAYFYLRSTNSDGLWYVHGQRPSLLIGAAVLSLLLVSAVVNSYGTRRLRRSADRADWMVSSGVTFILGVLGVGLQMWELTRLPFQPAASGYASVFVGWQPVMLLALVGGLYWLETLIARAVRVRHVLRPLAITARDPDVTMFRGSLDGFTLYWSFLAFVEIIFFLLFYVVR